MVRYFILASLLATAVLNGCGTSKPQETNPEEAWNNINDPMHFSSSYERKFANLPTSGSLAKKPWSDTYWPSYQGGIAARWRVQNSNNFSYKPYSLAELKTLNPESIARLSPAEKYDILQGKFDYPTVQKERARTGPNFADWEGLCHGWAPAAMLYNEPQPVTLTSPDGIQISMGSSDIKALLTYYHGEISSAATAFLGSRCNVNLDRYPGSANSPECRDTNAGAFHIVLTNQIGRWKRSFLIDITRDAEVWNQPIYSYHMTVDPSPRQPSLGAAPGTVKEIVVQADVSYSVETTAQPYAHGATLDHQIYRYRLEIDAAGNIIGGEWLTSNRPDFLWQQEKPQYAGYYANIEKIYETSVGDLPEPQPTEPPSNTTPTPTPSVTPTSSPSPSPSPTATVSPSPTATAIPQPTVTPTGSPTAAPTQLPTPVPTAVPTAQPWPTPTTVPTHYPTVYPTTMPTNYPTPLPTFFPAPGNGGGQGQSGSVTLFYCPTNYIAVQLNQNPFQPKWACLDKSSGSFVHGPFPQTMVDACFAQHQSSNCYNSVWSTGTYLQIRGHGVCPNGTTQTNGLCFDAQGFAFGPFPVELVQNCRDYGHGKVCEALVWSYNLVKAVQ